MEMAHRIFKEWLEKNTHHDSHRSAVELALSRDWSARLYSLIIIWTNGTDCEKAAAERGLQRLLLGSSCNKVDVNQDGNEEFMTVLEELRNKIPEAFRDPIITQLHGNTRQSFLPIEQEYWEVTDTKHGHELSKHQLKGLSYVSKYYKELLKNGDVTVQSFAAATYMKQEKYCKPRSCVSAHSRIEEDTFVSILTSGDTSNILLTSARSTGCVRSIFQVKCFYKTNTGERWALLDSLSKGDTENQFSIQENPKQHIIRLTTSLRRVAVLHNCDDKCTLRAHGLTTSMYHNQDNRNFTILTSREGYPPHMG